MSRRTQRIVSKKCDLFELARLLIALNCDANIQRNQFSASPYSKKIHDVQRLFFFITN
jgi:hypothetical protein